ncbi:hypothetical protein ACFXJ5_08670 [Streptomyces sp. NPDC059373]
MPLPSIDLTLAPQVVDGAATGVHVRYQLRGLSLAAGDTLCRLPVVIVGVDGSKVAPGDLTANDEAGPIPLTHVQDEPTPSWTYRRWQLGRATQGEIRVEYFAPVRVVDAAHTNGPLFDLRAEGAGVSGAGVSFLAIPECEGDFDTEVRWDLAGPAGDTRGVSNYGEGTVRRTAALESLTYTFYMAGELGSYPSVPDESFGMYWLSQPAFDTAQVGARIKRIYDDMCDFFREPAPGHRVFVRKHPFRGGGGTALPRAFMFGWSEAQSRSVEELTSLLAHETVHNWPTLQGEHSEISWYTEGTAEYYSLVLPHRTGLRDDDEFLDQLNKRAHGYYANPLQQLTFDEAARQYWKDWRAQRVPYGRGLFYFIDLNHKVRSSSGGSRGLDDLVLTVLDRQRAGQDVGMEEWLELVAAEIGAAGRTDFDAMLAGQRILPAAQCLGPDFVADETDIRQLDLGFDYSSLTSAVVTGLVNEGVAASAGIREGDVILDGPTPHELAQGPVQEIVLTLRRAGDTLKVSYVPSSAWMTGRIWKKRPA